MGDGRAGEGQAGAVGDFEREVERLQAERAQTLATFRDGRRSPYAAVARHDFAGGALTLGSAEDCEVRLAGLAPHHMRVRVAGDEFVLEALDEGATLRVAAGAEVRAATVGTGARVEVGRFVLRFSHQNFPGVVVLDPQSPALGEGAPPRWFAPDPAFRVLARLVRDPAPREEIVLSTRGFQRRALRVGWFEAALGGQPIRLAALRLLEPGVDEAAVSLFFRDATTGHESYPVGRYLDPVAVPDNPDLFVLDFNRAYNPACAFSPHYSCPIPPRENVLPVAVRAGEQDPHGH